jgi:hypothetical protein
VHEHTAHIDEGDGAGQSVILHASVLEGIADLSGHPDTRRSRPHDHHALSAQRDPGHARGREDAGENAGAGALDVVVERGKLRSVAIEQIERVLLLEILPLQEGAGEPPPGRLDELLHQRVVWHATQAGVAPAEIEIVREQRGVVGAHVEADGQRLARGDAGGGGIDGELPDRDAHAPRALITQTQDPLVVGDDDEPHIGGGGVGQHAVDVVTVLRRDPQATGLPEYVAELLAGLTHGGCVDDRQELFQMVAQDTIEQTLVPVVEGGEPDVLLQGIPLAHDVGVRPP